MRCRGTHVPFSTHMFAVLGPGFRIGGFAGFGFRISGVRFRGTHVPLRIWGVRCRGVRLRGTYVPFKLHAPALVQLFRQCDLVLG